jgi:hypothetical protein
VRADDVDLVLLGRANNNGGVLGDSALGVLVEAIVLLLLLLPVCKFRTVRAVAKNISPKGGGGICKS